MHATRGLRSPLTLLLSLHTSTTFAFQCEFLTCVAGGKAGRRPSPTEASPAPCFIAFAGGSSFARQATSSPYRSSALRMSSASTAPVQANERLTNVFKTVQGKRVCVPLSWGLLQCTY